MFNKISFEALIKFLDSFSKLFFFDKIIFHNVIKFFFLFFTT